MENSSSKAGKKHNYSAENLVELRKMAQLSRRELLEKLEDYGLKMHPTTLRRLEDGDQAMKIDESLAFAEIFDMGLMEFISRPVNAVAASVRTWLVAARAHEHEIQVASKEWLTLVRFLEGIPSASRFQGPSAAKEVRELKKYLDEKSDLIEWLEAAPFPVRQEFENQEIDPDGQG